MESVKEQEADSMECIANCCGAAPLEAPLGVKIFFPNIFMPAFNSTQCQSYGIKYGIFPGVTNGSAPVTDLTSFIDTTSTTCTAIQYQSSFANLWGNH